MTSSPAASDASHESGDDGANTSTSKQHATKDKECPYCHQKFTSSSLGRHLDQFIKKKKPDGLHDVEGIKKLRSGITRRTARGKKNEHEDQQDGNDSNAQPSPVQESSTGTIPGFTDQSKKPRGGGGGNVQLDRMGWQATGVMTTDQLSPPQPSTINTPIAPTPEQQATAHPTTNTPVRPKRTFSAFTADNNHPLPATDHTRALELSLREVLDAVQVATKRAAPVPSPFPFDITTQTYPSLVLALLPPPPTLFQPAPFATLASMPLRPPGPEQLQPLCTKIREILDQWKWDALAHLQRNPPQTLTQQPINVGEQAARLDEQVRKHVDDALRHLDTAFQYYMSQPAEAQYQQWTVELLRAWKLEQDKLRDAKAQITRISQEAAQLQQQVDYLSRCQWPREMALWPPERAAFSEKVQQELQTGRSDMSTLENMNIQGNMPFLVTSTAGEARWDFDKLVKKWTRHVREDRARRGAGNAGGAGGCMRPPLTENSTSELGRTGTPPYSAMRKSTSDGTTQHQHNGHNHKPASNSQTNSPTVRNGNHSGSLSITDKPMTFASANSNKQSFVGMSSVPPRTQTPTQNIRVISDVDDHMARFAPWFKQQEREEREDRMAVGE